MIQKSILLLGLVCMMALLMAACSGEDATVPAGHPLGTISGTVTDTSTNHAISGVKVEIRASAFPSDTTMVLPIVIVTTTDANGKFIRMDVPSGNIQVRVSKSGYRTPAIQNWALSGGGSSDFVFEMSPGQDPASKFDNDGREAWPPAFDPTK
jgi:hypothetical protein